RSVANQTSRPLASDSLAARLRSLTTLSLPWTTSYVGRKSCLRSTPGTGLLTPLGFLLGRSRMCPTLARTRYSGPRYLLMVLALEGDSTITRWRFLAAPAVYEVPRGRPRPNPRRGASATAVSPALSAFFAMLLPARAALCS